MPVATVRYRFEYRLFDWAESRVHELSGERTSMLVALREDGSLRRIYFSTPKGWTGEQKNSMIRTNARWLLFVPQKEPGCGYLEWDELPVGVVKRWMGRALVAADLADVTGGDPLDRWPESWRVVLG